MPDYGDDRGFRSRGVPGVPADIGFDRAGPVRRNPMEGYRLGDVTVSDQMGGNTHYDPDKIDRFRAEDRARALNSVPIQSGGRGGEFAPPLYSGRNPFIQPIQTGGRYGEFPAMDSGQYLASKFGGGIDDAAGMNDDARGMIEGAGFDVAASEGMTDKRVFRDLWGKAVNKFPPGTPDMILQQEWERLKQIYRDKKYGVDTGLTLPSRDDIVGMG